MQYADYTFYEQKYGGRLPQSTYDALALRAAAALDRLTYDRCRAAILREGCVCEIKLAFCAVCDELARIDSVSVEGGEVVSETVGKWSRTVKTDERSTERRLYDAAAMYLTPQSGLLYRGVR
ncbi:MAG: hypothetical protein GXZ14_00855 [Ruminococcaceae bacterium]|nr:hypothetical protein [Oscillospiraceae bacterium]